MKGNGTPQLDGRQAQAIVQEMLARLPAYVPGWQPAQPGPSWAVIQVFARYLQALVERLNQAPDKNKLAFLDLLGIDLLPAQAARTPVVFQAIPDIGDSRVPAGTRVGAKIPGQDEPLVFETESAIGLAAARLVEVVTLWPSRDAYADHSAAVARGTPFSLFEPLQPVPHELYLAHNVYLALTGKATVELQFELTPPGDQPLPIAWEYWDGTVWQGFKEFAARDQPGESFDGANGLTRSGVIRLTTVCGESATTQVNGIDAYWVRGRLTGPLPPQPGARLPALDRIRLRTVIERPLQGAGSPPSCTGGIAPDQALADASTLDVSKTFFPLGRTPNATNVFYFSSEEVFSKPGAEVTLCFSRAKTPEEEADNLASDHELDVQAAVKLIVDAACKAAQSLVDAAQGVMVTATPSAEKDELQAKVEALQTATNALSDTTGIGSLVALAGEVVTAFGGVEGSLGDLLNFQVLLGPQLVLLLTTTDGTEIVSTIESIISGLNAAVQSSLDTTNEAMNEAKAAASNAHSVLNALSNLSPLEAAAASGKEPPKLSPPRLVWEYWNGSGWQSLLGPVDDDAANFLDSGQLSFVVPEDLEPVSVNGVTARWLRVRLASGSYGRLRLVSWYNAQSNDINLLPVIEQQPPALKGFFLGYTYRSPKASPEHCLTYNDFRFEDHTEDARWPGPAFAPFRPVEDTWPALYLGFDRPLPADLIGLYVDIQEIAGQSEGPPLQWEYHNGAAWLPLSVMDETHHLALPGMIAVVWPGVAGPPPVPIVQAGGSQVRFLDARQAARFAEGDLLYIAQQGAGELATVAGVERDILTLTTPLKQNYTGATIGPAALPRFGTPRTWIRARLKAEGPPLRSQLTGIHLNAAWAAQVQTVENEMLGSSTGQPGQVFFFRQTPVLAGEVVEVRELEGPRAPVELPMLREELLQQGLTDADIRTVADRRTGRLNEVWVRWKARPHLFFSRPSDRHYTVERSRGRLIFGDNEHGRIPPPGADNIRAQVYRTGGGLGGNVPAGAISQLLAGVLAQGVAQPHNAEGGADGEAVEAVLARGPKVTRHRRQALSQDDYEALAREASPAVAVARALPATHASGRPAPGWVTVLIMPHSHDPQPQPSFELRRLVRDYLAARAPATIAGRIAVAGPEYLPIGVEAHVAPVNPQEAGLVGERVRQALTRFLHPLTGGPAGEGWPFGRDIFLSDVAAALEAIPGVDFVETINLLLDGTPWGEWIDVPRDRIVVAGPLHITLKRSE